MGKGDGRKSGGGGGSSGFSRPAKIDDHRRQSHSRASPDRSRHRRESKKSRKPSSSSSSSSSTGKKTRAAKKTLEKHDAEYRKYVQQREQQEQEAHFKRQGELLASALNAKLDAVIQPRSLNLYLLLALSFQSKGISRLMVPRRPNSARSRPSLSPCCLQMVVLAPAVTQPLRSL